MLKTEATGADATKEKSDTLRVSSSRGGNGDADSEAEFYPNGRTGEVDADTKGKAYAFCREFLSGVWKNITEADFQISIIR